MNLYNVDVVIVATAYVRADTEAAARRKAQGLYLQTMITDSADGLQINGDYFDDLLLSDADDVTISPAMTVIGPADQKTLHYLGFFDEAYLVDLVHEGDDTDTETEEPE